MALQKNITAATGLEVVNAYIKVDEYSCYGDTVHARLRAYVSRDLANSGAAHIEGSEDIVTLTANYENDAPNAKKQIYEYAKTLEKYTDAIDV